MPTPFGHCGQLMSPPSTIPGFGVRGSLGTVTEGVGTAAVVSGEADRLTVLVGVADGTTTDAEGVGPALAFLESGVSGASQAQTTRATRASKVSSATRANRGPV